MINHSFIFFLMLLLFASSCNSEEVYVIKSPDSNYEVTINAHEGKGVKYRVLYKDKEIILPSLLGLSADGEKNILHNTEVLSVTKDSHKGTWKPVYGEKNIYNDNYNSLKLMLKSKSDKEIVSVVFRCYNEGVAYRYEFENENKDSITIKKELSEFVLPENSTAWVTYSAQGLINEIPVEDIKKPAERPLVVKEENGLYLALGEAALVDYARMKFIRKKKGSSALVAVLDGDVNLLLPAKTPWRYIMAGEKTGDILENNYLLLNLNEPNKLKDVSWIKPGKVIREITLTTKGGRECVDFAVEHNLQFVEFDAGWYGHEYDDLSDATTITVDPKRSEGPLELHKIIRYAKERNVGIILYVNRRAMLKQLDEILPLYEKWGVAGVKYGFVGVGTQQWTNWLLDAVRKAADHHLMVDVHDEYRPTGFMRTYPNFMTCEGVRGDEESPTNEHTLKTMFTRSIAGAADNTVCYYDPRVEEKMGSHVSQLAKTVCIYSPWQFLFWYDKPSVIGDEPELEFFDSVPTVWDDKIVIEGEIGKYGTIARRNRDNWYIGSINGDNPHKVIINFDFLEEGKDYNALIYSDDSLVNSRTKVRVEREIVNRSTVLEFNIAPNNGVAVRLFPAD
ncbi:MAG: glycoside hydrolase family 97 protein [Chlorobi bacterium]|nr:glycoside hydrolase family 97 protein [Chlorobiota bacterium]